MRPLHPALVLALPLAAVIVVACGPAGEGEGEGDDVGEGEGDDVGEGEGDDVGEGEGDAAAPPSCQAFIASINGVANTDDEPHVAPGDALVFGVDAAAATADGTITAFAWTLVAAPPNSSSTLTSASDPQPSFVVDVAGAYALAVDVTDDRGAHASCDLDVVAVRRDGVLVQLTWDQAGADLDLHVVDGGVDWCSAADVRGVDTGDGLGPENVNVEVLASGRLTVGVGAFAIDAPTTATVKVFIGGALEFEGFQRLDVGDSWFPLAVDVDDVGVATVDLSVAGALPTGDCWGEAAP